MQRVRVAIRNRRMGVMKLLTHGTAKITTQGRGARVRTVSATGMVRDAKMSLACWV